VVKHRNEIKIQIVHPATNIRRGQTGRIPSLKGRDSKKTVKYIYTKKIKLTPRDRVLEVIFKITDFLQKICVFCR
jgi:hypothetical protein